MIVRYADKHPMNEELRKKTSKYSALFRIEKRMKEKGKDTKYITTRMRELEKDMLQIRKGL